MRRPAATTASLPPRVIVIAPAASTAGSMFGLYSNHVRSPRRLRRCRLFSVCNAFRRKV
jgi:hypothetical protein